MMRGREREKLDDEDENADGGAHGSVYYGVHGCENYI